VDAPRKLLLVDDDRQLLDLLAYAFGQEGYDVATAGDGQQALTCWRIEQPDLVVLDVNLPQINGFEVCRHIRQGSDTPIILLTGRDEEADVVRGLQLGADDYVTKPFSPRQLAARVHSVLRRYRGNFHRPPADRIRAGNLVVDHKTHTAIKGGKTITLTRLEFQILYLLAINEGRVVPYTRLIEYAWGYDDQNSSILLRSHISHLRRKLGTGARGAGSIHAVSGVGYLLSR